MSHIAEEFREKRAGTVLQIRMLKERRKAYRRNSAEYKEVTAMIYDLHLTKDNINRKLKKHVNQERNAGRKARALTRAAH